MRALEEGNVKRSPVRPRTIIRGQDGGQGGIWPGLLGLNITGKNNKEGSSSIILSFQIVSKLSGIFIPAPAAKLEQDVKDPARLLLGLF